MSTGRVYTEITMSATSRCCYPHFVIEKTGREVKYLTKATQLLNGGDKMMKTGICAPNPWYLRAKVYGGQDTRFLCM